MRDGAIVLGMRRSGSTLAFNLVRELMTKELENGILRTTYADGDAADRFVETALRRLRIFGQRDKLKADRSKGA